MTIKSVELIGTGGSGFNLTSESWTATFRICLDEESCNCSDVRTVILRGLQFTEGPHYLPFLGDSWPPALPAACDNASSVAYVKSLQPDGEFYKHDGGCCLNVVANYEFNPEAGDDPDDNPVDPFDSCPRIDTYTQTELEEVENSIFKGAYKELAQEDPPDPDINLCTNRCQGFEPDLLAIDNNCYQRDLDSCGPVVNAAGQPFNPPIEREFTLHGYRITYFVPFYDEFDSFRCFENTSNCEDFELTILCRNFSKIFKKDTAYLRSVVGTPAEVRTLNPVTGDTSIVRYWEVTYDILEDPRGWCRDILNAGILRSACVDDPDGHGGTYLTSPSDGEPTTAAILNREGHAITEPVRLGIDGLPLDPNEGSWFLRYAIDGCTDFTDPLLGLGAVEVPDPEDP